MNTQSLPRRDLKRRAKDLGTYKFRHDDSRLLILARVFR